MHQEILVVLITVGSHGWLDEMFATPYNGLRTKQNSANSNLARKQLPWSSEANLWFTIHKYQFRIEAMLPLINSDVNRHFL
ncbi:hypothetical protein BD779DRAFT_396861 [Infundibulicybe gibba]|nr:hypothetical protein BD779DRAFT_396861 [Infundibulicybe gibba]